MFPDIGGRPARLAIGAWQMNRAIGSPDLLAGALVQSGDELFLLVVVDKDDEVIHKGGGRCRAEPVNRREVFKRSVPDLVPGEIVGEGSEVIDVDIDALAVGGGGFGAEAV